MNNERTISYAVGVVIPLVSTIPVEEVFKECCYVHYVLASSSDSNELINDYSGFYHNWQTSSDNPEFYIINTTTLVETLLDGTYGELSQFDGMTTYRLDWRSVLTTLGSAAYKVVKRYSVSGVNTEQEYLVYTLKEYSQGLSNGTIRIDTVTNGFMEETKANFRGTDFKTSLRVKGFFGNRDFENEIDNLVDKNYVKNQVSVKQTNEYKCQIGSVPSCITDEVIDFILFANSIKITDYNLNNHSYDYKMKDVSYVSNDGSNYNPSTRLAMLNTTFTDKNSNKIERY